LSRAGAERPFADRYDRGIPQLHRYLEPRSAAPELLAHHPDIPQPAIVFGKPRRDALLTDEVLAPRTYQELA